MTARSASSIDPSEPCRRRVKLRLARAGERYVVNRLVRAGFGMNLAPSAYALLETTGRKTGRKRRIPVANGLDGISASSSAFETPVPYCSPSQRSKSPGAVGASIP